MGELPLPIAALALRARNAKSAKERHDLSYFAWEASVRLAVAARPPADRSQLGMPSTGHWISALASDERLLDNAVLLDAHQLFAQEGLERGSRPKTTTLTRLLEGMPGYRNKVIGHGAVRSSEYYERAGDMLLGGVEAAWSADVFWLDVARLVYIESVEVDSDGRRRGRVLDLTGPAGRVIDPRGSPVPDDAFPRRLYQRSGDAYRSLHPWLVFQAAELSERVLFFNGRGRTSRYLDYVSGEQVKSKELAEIAPEIEANLDAAIVARADEPEAVQDPSRFGDYRLLGKLGEGGMGVVYLARQESLGRLVALKMLPPGASEDAVTVARFRREIAALARCEHPNVIKILASGCVERTHYYTMELVEGADLAGVALALPSTDDFDAAVSTASERVRVAKADAFAHVPQLPPRKLGPSISPRPTDRVRKLVELFRDAALGVEHLHELGIVHRDLKPANLMVTAGDHRVVVMDLGLAALGDASQSITKDKSALLGTLRYMPPEQLQRNLLQLDRRADVYSLGATFYELLVGRPMFDGDSEVRLLEQVLREAPMPPGVANPHLPRDIATILSKAIEKDPKLRYDTARSLANDVEAYLAGRPIAARPPTLGYLLGLAIRKHRALAVTISTAIVLAVAGATLFLMRERELRRDAQSERVRADEQSQIARAQTAMATAQGLIAEARHVEAIDYAAASTTRLDSERALALIRTAANIPGADAYRIALDADLVERAVAAPTRAIPVHGGWSALRNDGRAVAIGDRWGSSRVVEIVSLDTGESVDRFAFPPGETKPGAQAGRAVFSPDDTLLAITEAPAPIKAPGLDVRAQLLRDMPAHVPPDPLSHPIGSQKSDPGAGPSTLWLWNFTTKVADLSVVLPSNATDLVFSHDGHKLALVLASGELRLWRSGTPNLTILARDATAISSVAFSPDDSQLAVGAEDGTVALWKLEPTPVVRITTSVRSSSSGPLRHVADLAWSARGDQLIGIAGQSVQAWSAETGTELAGFKMWFPAHVQRLALRNDTLFVAGDLFFLVTLTPSLDLVDGSDKTAPDGGGTGFSSGDCKPTGVAISEYKDVAFGCDDGTFFKWNRQHERQRLSRKDHYGAQIGFTARGELVAYGGDVAILPDREAPSRSYPLTASFDNHIVWRENRVFGQHFANERTVKRGDNDGLVVLDTGNGSVVSVKAATYGLGLIAAKDGTRVLSCLRSQNLGAFDERLNEVGEIPAPEVCPKVPTDKKKETFSNGEPDVAMDKSGSVIAIPMLTGVEVWRPANGSHHILPTPDRVQHVALSSDGTLLAFTTVGHVQVWRLDSDRLDRELATSAVTTGLGFDRNGERLVVASESSAMVFDLKRGESVFTSAHRASETIDGSTRFSNSGIPSSKIAIQGNFLVIIATGVDIYNLATGTRNHISRQTWEGRFVSDDTIALLELDRLSHWDLATAQLIAESPRDLSLTAVSPDGRSILGTREMFRVRNLDLFTIPNDPRAVLLDRIGRQTNFRVCKDTNAVVAIVPFPPADTYFADPKSCTPAN